MNARRPMAAAVLAAIAVAALVAVALWSRGQGAARGPSVAVLPFASDAGPETRYFSDGFHDTIISQLARIHGLKVISRASVLGYREGPRDLARIGRDLGVAHLVEGEVRRMGERLRVSARLVAAGTGRQLWSGEYDRGIADIFSIHSDVARQIATAIDARITLEEEARLMQAPTRDLQAYELYLRALEVETRSPPNKAALLEAIGWTGEALARDPQFALAHALACRLHLAIYWVVGEYDKARLPVAERHAQRAVELAPQFAESHLAMALYWYWGHRDYDKALASLDDARTLEPNSSSVYFLAGSIYRRLGRWNFALTQAAWAAQLDPRNARNLQVYVDILSATREFEEAEKVHAALAAAAPRSPLAHLMRMQNLARWTGAAGPDAGDKRFEPKEDPYCLSQSVQYDLHMLRREFAQAAAAILSCPGDGIGALHNVPTPKEQLAAIAYHFAGEQPLAAENARKARAQLEKRLDARPDLVLTRMGLAYVLAIEGDRARALAEAGRAVADMPMADDAIVGAEVRDLAAALHAYLGEHERALAELADTLDMAFGSYAQLVNVNPFWDPLREDPRFKALVAEHMPSVPWRYRF